VRFTQWVAAQNSEEDSESLARRAIEEIPGEVITIVGQEIEHVRRFELRATESFLELIRTQPGVLVERFALSDGTNVSWGRATVEQHSEGIQVLWSTVAETINTIERHQAAIDALDAGAACLDELAGEDEVGG
jgi:hypothetical protein